MNIVRMILKEAGGRFENAAGSIDSKDNMFRGSSGNAISDKIGGGENNNPVMNQEETTTETETTTPELENKTETTDTPEVETDTTDMTETETFSDEKLKDGYSSYKKMESKPLSGRLRNLDLSISPKMNTQSAGGSMSGFSNMMSNFGGGEGAEGADMASDVDAGDMADAADAASDERLKRIFGDDEDAIKCFANINAIKFTYNDKAHEIPGGENKGIDDDPHYGVKAQELAENPLTQTAVTKDPISEYLQVDTKELTMANTAIISEICKRILIIEKVLGIKVV
jgi:hypothetical protein